MTLINQTNQPPQLFIVPNHQELKTGNPTTHRQRFRRWQRSIHTSIKKWRVNCCLGNKLGSDKVMSDYERAIEIHLASNKEEIEEARYRVSLKHQLKEAGVPYDPKADTEQLERLVEALT